MTLKAQGHTHPPVAYSLFVFTIYAGTNKTLLDTIVYYYQLTWIRTFSNPTSAVYILLILIYMKHYMRQVSSFFDYRLGGCAHVFVKNIFNIITDLNVFHELTFSHHHPKLRGLIFIMWCVHVLSSLWAHGPILKAQDIHDWS